VSAAPDGKKQPPEMSFAYANRASTALLAVGDIDAIRAPISIPRSATTAGSSP
jgi:hypothetical protein